MMKFLKGAIMGSMATAAAMMVYKDMNKNTKNKNCPSRYTHGRRNIFYCKNIPKRTTVHPFRNTLSVYTLCIKYSCFPPRKNIGIVSSAASASIHLPPSNTSPEPAQVNVSPAGKYTLRLCAPL